MTKTSTKPCTKFRYGQLRSLAKDQVALRVESFDTRDRKRLRFRVWRPTSPIDRAIVVLQSEPDLIDKPHAGQSTSLVDERTAVFSLDLTQSDDVRSLSKQMQDLEDFVRHISNQNEFGPNDILVIADGDATVALAGWVHS